MCLYNKFSIGESLVDTGSVLMWLGFWFRVSISMVSIIDTCTIPALALGHKCLRERG